jgi:hypothetical protein
LGNLLERVKQYIDENGLNRVLINYYETINDEEKILYTIDMPIESVTSKDENQIIEPTETELIQAELLLNQADIIAKQNEQDEVLAEILLNQMGV